MDDVIILTDRDEFADLIGEDISDDVWLEIKVKLAKNKHMWQAIDETINEVASEYSSVM